MLVPLVLRAAEERTAVMAPAAVLVRRGRPAKMGPKASKAKTAVQELPVLRAAAVPLEPRDLTVAKEKRATPVRVVLMASEARTGLLGPRARTAATAGLVLRVLPGRLVRQARAGRTVYQAAMAQWAVMGARAPPV